MFCFLKVRVLVPQRAGGFGGLGCASLLTGGVERTECVQGFCPAMTLKLSKHLRYTDTDPPTLCSTADASWSVLAVSGGETKYVSLIFSERFLLG